MTEIYLSLLVLLFLLAITDLVVGVSNDAVNFLNSAIGSKVAAPKIIMLTASLGIFIGATFSSGIMEVARKGIFFPDQFLFSEVMIIFVAVMLSDIILLDLFNTFGLPTSTTVSIIFELLGAAFAVSMLKILGGHPGTLSQFINGSRAADIILGIFLSILIAFIVGTIIQYLSRLLFSFRYKKNLRYFGAIWCGLALTAITYFLLIKGAKGASFISDDLAQSIQNNALWIMVVSLLVWSVLLQILQMFLQTNPLKIVVLFGTFSLAMAFAGNDLVNFIGVPIAGLESFKAWSNSGVAPESFHMEILNKAFKTDTYLLLIAGLVMVLTLWFSKKAKSVTETEVNLGRQSEGPERFEANWLSRAIVKATTRLGQSLTVMIPNKVLNKMGQKFRDTINTPSDGQSNPAAFDLVRASVNLTVASVLIAFATSLKLPLSTTYVSFMVAMGTSLADKAWGRDAAVYRVSGVLSVVSGWLFTAFIAFLMAGTFAFLILHLGLWVIVVLVFLAVLFVLRTLKYHRSKELDNKILLPAFLSRQRITVKAAQAYLTEEFLKYLQFTKRIYIDSLNSLLSEEEDSLEQLRASTQSLIKENHRLRASVIPQIRRTEDDKQEVSKLYVLAYDLEENLLSCLDFITANSLNHVRNLHHPLSREQAKTLLEVIALIRGYIDLLITSVKQPDAHTKSEILKSSSRLTSMADNMLALQVNSIKKNHYNAKNSLLFFGIVLETNDLQETLFRMYNTLMQNGELPLGAKFKELESES